MKLTPATITTRNAAESLRSFHCPACGRPKHMGNPFCGRCWNRLAPSEHAALTREMAAGYHTALATALAQLEASKQTATTPGVRS
jgi:hypothetical protein